MCRQSADWAARRHARVSAESTHAFSKAVSISWGKLAHAHVRHDWKAVVRNDKAWGQFFYNFVLKRSKEKGRKKKLEKSVWEEDLVPNSSERERERVEERFTARSVLTIILNKNQSALSGSHSVLRKKVVIAGMLYESSNLSLSFESVTMNERTKECVFII